MRATRPFTPIFRVDILPAMEAVILDAAKGWLHEADRWGANHGTKKRQWPHPACSSYAAYNALEPYAVLHGHGMAIREIDPMSIHRLAMQIDGLEGGEAETATTLKAAMEAACQLANQTAGVDFARFARVPVDVVGGWLSVVSPVACEMKWWWQWTRYSWLWKTLQHPGANAPVAALHAGALVGWEPRKRTGISGSRVRAFEWHDSALEKLWIEAAAFVMALRGEEAYGYITPADAAALRLGRVPDGLRC